MKKLLAIATLLLASTAAQAQYTFEYGGHTIRIDPDRGTVQIPGVYDNTGKPAKRTKGEDSADRPQAKSPQETKTDPQTAPVAPPRACSGRAGSSAGGSSAAVPAAPAATTRTFDDHRSHRAGRYGGCSSGTSAAQRTAPQVNQQDAAPPRAPAPTLQRRRRHHRACRHPRLSRPQFAARRVADGREGRQGPHRAMRRQSLRLLGRQEVEPERRAGSDQHEARQGPNGAAGFSIRAPAAPMIPRSR